MTDKNPFYEMGYHCGDVPCNAGKTGICGMAKMLELQSTEGSNHPDGNDVWYRDSWEAVVNNVKKTAEGDCIYPDQLKFAIENHTPRRLVER